jgi:putative membrane protein
MPGFVVRALIAALGLWIASAIVPGFRLDGLGTYLLAGLLLGVVNAVVRPLAFFLTLPLTVVTLGLFLFVLNAGMVALVAAMLDRFTISGFFSAVFGALVVGLTSMVASWYVGPKGRVEVMAVRA